MKIGTRVKLKKDQRTCGFTNDQWIAHLDYNKIYTVTYLRVGGSEVCLNSDFEPDRSFLIERFDIIKYERETIETRLP